MEYYQSIREEQLKKYSYKSNPIPIPTLTPTPTPTLNYQHQVYFNWDEKDLPCIKHLFDRMKPQFPTLTKWVDKGTKPQPCILFNFVAINTRVDHVNLPRKSREWLKSAGTSIIVRVHNKEGKTYDDDSMNKQFHTYYNGNSGVILKWKFEHKLDIGKGGEPTQTLEQENTYMSELVKLIEEWKI